MWFDEEIDVIFDKIFGQQMQLAVLQTFTSSGRWAGLAPRLISSNDPPPSPSTTWSL